jgi:hypothetical protein
VIDTKNININWDSYKKRKKIFSLVPNGESKKHSRRKLWVDTKPLYIDAITKNITIWHPKNIIKFHYVNNTTRQQH